MRTFSQISLTCFVACFMVALFLIVSRDVFLLCAQDERAIEEVKQGKRDVAYASWWGFDPEDATKALQAAIDSGAKKVIVSNMGKPWIVSKTIILRSDQEVVFEEGVIVEAKRGAFLGRGDCLFLAALQKNISLIGYGATLRMRKQDYTKPPYEKAEWRHVLSIRSCENVRIYGLRLASSGGDGIYLGVAKRGIPNKNVHIKDVVCVDNHRQGISVISAEDVLMENVVMEDTSGTPPMAGIDFEPNEQTERLSNIVMRNCVSRNNVGDGFAFYLHNLNANSHPVSIRLEGCRSIGNRRGVSISVGNSKEKAVGGIIEFVNCSFEGSEGAGISISQKPTFGCRVRFIGCKIVNTALKQVTQAPIVLSSSAGNFEPIGGIEFVDCVVADEVERLPIAYFDFAGGLELEDVTGTLTLVRGTQKKSYNITPQLLNEWFPTQAFKRFPKFELEGVKLEPLFPSVRFQKGVSCKARLRGQAEFMLWAEKGEKVSFTIMLLPVGKVSVSPAKVGVLTPSNKKLTLAEAVYGRENAYSFTADEGGVYRIVCDAGRATATLSWSTHGLCIVASGGVFHFLGTEGEFYFVVPAGISEFGIKVWGGNEAERVKVTLRDDAGRVVDERDNIAIPYQFIVRRDKLEGDAVYSIIFKRPSIGVLEDFFVQLQGIPPILSCHKETLLKPSVSH